MACGLRRAARPTANTLIAKNTATRATPSTAPSSPFAPPTATLMTIMTAPAAAEVTVDRRENPRAARRTKHITDHAADGVRLLVKDITSCPALAPPGHLT